MNIEQLAKQRQEAKMAYECLAMMNTATLTIEQQIKLDVAYARAKAEYLRLNNAYHAWITSNND